MARVVIVGSSNTDMVVQVPHLPAPGETVMGGAFSTAAGGKGANQAVAAARTGGEVSLVARLGTDSFGEQALRCIRAEGIDTGHCRFIDDVPSGVAQILVADDGENSIAVAPGANARLQPVDIAAAESLLAEAAVVLVQLETPVETVLDVARRVSAGDALLILDPAPAQSLPEEIYPLLDVITPNETEAHRLTGVPLVDEHSAAAAANALHERGVGIVVLTRGAGGVYLSEQRNDGSISSVACPAFAVNVVDTTAAGDVFNGCLAVALARGQAIVNAVEFAQAAAALSVQILGAQPSAPHEHDVRKFLHDCGR